MAFELLPNIWPGLDGFTEDQPDSALSATVILEMTPLRIN